MQTLLSLLWLVYAVVCIGGTGLALRKLFPITGN